MVKHTSFKLDINEIEQHNLGLFVYSHFGVGQNKFIKWNVKISSGQIQLSSSPTLKVTPPVIQVPVANWAVS